jgi:hypothetical protein
MSSHSDLELDANGMIDHATEFGFGTVSASTAHNSCMVHRERNYINDSTSCLSAYPYEERSSILGRKQVILLECHSFIAEGFG